MWTNLGPPPPPPPHVRLDLAGRERIGRIHDKRYARRILCAFNGLKKLGTLSTQSLIDGLWVMGWPCSFIEGARPLAPGMKCVGRAVTMNFVPHRPDIAADKPGGAESPE